MINKSYFDFFFLKKRTGLLAYSVSQSRVLHVRRAARDGPDLALARWHIVQADSQPAQQMRCAAPVSCYSYSPTRFCAVGLDFGSRARSRRPRESKNLKWQRSRERISVTREVAVCSVVTRGMSIDADEPRSGGNDCFQDSPQDR